MYSGYFSQYLLFIGLERSFSSICVCTQHSFLLPWVIYKTILCFSHRKMHLFCNTCYCINPFVRRIWFPGPEKSLIHVLTASSSRSKRQKTQMREKERKRRHVSEIVLLYCVMSKYYKVAHSIDLRFCSQATKILLYPDIL